jgi:ATP-binding cassette subfamily C (CFTR/MRP) protein 4
MAAAPIRPRLSWSYGHPEPACRSCCNFISFATFSFAKPILNRGRTLANQTRTAVEKGLKPPSPLNKDDLPTVLDPTTEYQTQLRDNWKLEQKQHPNNPKYWKAVLNTFIQWHGCFLVLSGGSRIFGAIVLGNFVQQLENLSTPTPTSSETWWTFLYAFFVLLGTWMTSVGHHSFYYYAWSNAMKMKVANVGLIYQKTTKLSLGALGEATTGRIFNLAAGDTMRLQFGLMFLPYFLWGPIEALIVLFFLVREIGWAASIGWLFFILVFVPLQLFFSRWFANLQFAASKAADQRLKLTTEVVTGAACVKSHCWEQAFVQLVDQARSKEIGILSKIATLRGLNEGIFFSSTTIVGTLIFVVHTYFRGLTMEPKSVLVVLQLLLILQLTMAKFLCMAIMGFSQSWISMDRIGTFLLSEEVVEVVENVENDGGTSKNNDTDATTTKSNGGKEQDSTVAIQYTNASASWIRSNRSKKNRTTVASTISTTSKSQQDENEEEMIASDTVLSNLNLMVKRGDFVVVVGPVGAGKTSLLMSMLSELPLSNGSLYMPSDIQRSTSYVGQTPYIQSGTVRDNILFGKSMNTDKFKRVCKACALDTDIRALSNAELTLVGEKGVTLSGGQRARVALARAAYAQASLVLLDDPLSAVDPQVAALLVDNVIMADVNEGGLRQTNGDGATTVVLCTHQVQFANRADVVVVFGANGEMVACGSYNELKNHPALYREEDEKNEKDDKDDSREQQDTKDTKDVTLIVETPVETLETSMETMMNKLRSLSTEQRDRSGSTTSSTQGVRQTSTRSAASSASSFDGGNSKVLTEETAKVAESRAIGVVSVSTYAKYLQAGGGWAMFLPLTMIMLLGQGMALFSSFTMTVLAKSSTGVNYGNSTESVIVNDGALSHLQFHQVVVLLVVLALASMLIAMVRSMWFFWALVQGAKNLHKQMLRAVARAPMYFYHTNPTGRILNRFGADLAFVDDQMPQSAFDFVSIGMQVAGTVVMASVANPFVLVVLIPLVFAFNWLRSYYMDTSREIKRVEALSRSPIFSQLSETLSGLVAMRSYSNIIENSIDLFNQRLDVNQSHFFAFIATARYFGFRLDFINHFFTFCCIASVLLLRFVFPEFGEKIIDSNLVGLSILYLMQGGDGFQWCVRQAAEVENMMVSVERINEYVSIEPEAALKRIGQIEQNWPKTGTVELNKLNLQYSAKGPVVLKDVSLTIQAGNKVALVGRTGAGKSSLLSALFRLTEATSGSIKIDGVDINKLGLHDARGLLSIIPQEPWLFSGTIRKNIDPFERYSDDVIWNAINVCQLNAVFKSLQDILTESGNNLSTGERQLVCLARAIVNPAKIIVLDEATANVDQGTDRLIQKTVREHFANRTLIVIAHRINTIIDSDVVVVLDAGKIIEQGVPHLLLTDEQGSGKGKHFASMVDETGEEAAKYLRKAAKLSFDLRATRSRS